MQTQKKADQSPLPGFSLANGGTDSDASVRSRATDDPLVISADQFDAVLFDMDGVVTQTATVHLQAWKKVFDQLLESKDGDSFQSFSPKDYLEYVDGKPREDGVKSFLDARKIELPEGAPGDNPGLTSVNSIAELKDEEFLKIVHDDGVKAYASTVALIKSLKSAGISVGLVTASQNGKEILRVAKLNHLFDATVTGIDTRDLHLKGKPEPDSFLECARRLAVLPQRAIVVEDAEAGVAAGKHGHFGRVIGVARQDNQQSLLEHGATVAVADLSEISVPNADGASDWLVTYTSFEAEHEMQRESLCALGNGKFCTRGAWPFSVADGVHYPGTYVAGGYDSITIDSEGRRFDREELVNMPNWLCLNFRLDDGQWFGLADIEILDFGQILDLRKGILERSLRVRDGKGREIALSERQFVHMRYSHLAGVELRITPLNWSGTITVRSGIDGTVVNNGDGGGVNFKGNRHLKTLDKGAEGDVVFLKVSTLQTELVVAIGARTSYQVDDETVLPVRKVMEESDAIWQEVPIELTSGQCATVCKTIALYTSRDRGTYEALVGARRAVADAPDFGMLVSEQAQAWRSLWRQFDLDMQVKDGRDQAKKLIPSLLVHLNSFHTIQTASPHTVDLDTGIPPRGWTGEGYQGHIFWDDLFVFPFINLRLPNISAALLKYRYRRINEARKIARTHGALGACYPWESASDGRERTPDCSWMSGTEKWIEDFTNLEIHVNGAIAYNVWQYFQVTADFSFMYSYGGEVMLEIARFFATFARYNADRDRYEIHGVIGPDEFHKRYLNADKPGINNNAYTNILAVWTLCRALEFLEVMPPDLRSHMCERLHITEEEKQLWEDVSRKMFVPFTADGIIEQFEGFSQLAEFPGFQQGAINEAELNAALAKNDGVLNQYKICKQADLLMLMYIFSPNELGELFERLGYKYDDHAMAANADYYIPRTANESTLSRVAHAWVLSRLDRLRRRVGPGHLLPPCQQLAKCSADIFYEALGSDFYDIASRGTARTGIHMGAMAGTVDIVQRCYTGIVTRDDVLWFDPDLPDLLNRLSFTMRYRRHSLTVDISREKLTVGTRSYSDEPIKVGCGADVFVLKNGEYREIALSVTDGAEGRQSLSDERVEN
ncbi:MAG: beta-phosphoglucomutase family hydrolase [Cyanobacteria bacterium REEB67]|nr:beta-phosphoglucomutase family hydrolase [Cyanobacteria bacterium REEB67]